MNKIKMALVATAILVAVGGAFATRPCVQCDLSVQYYNIGNGYVEAGEFGLNYDCWTATAGICTYYKPDPIGQPNNYAPCKMGAYMRLD